MRLSLPYESLCCLRLPTDSCEPLRVGESHPSSTWVLISARHRAQSARNSRGARTTDGASQAPGWAGLLVASRRKDLGRRGDEEVVGSHAEIKLE